jgi:hypothetical protein
LRLSGFSFFSSGSFCSALTANFGGDTLIAAMLANSIAISSAGMRRNMMFMTGSRFA